MQSVLEFGDWIVLGLYFLALIGVAIWVILQKNKNTEDYFLAGRNVGWFVIGASIFASNIGSKHVVGLAGTGVESKMPMAHYELHAWIVLVLGWLFLPFYMRSKVFTMPEFLEKRFDSRSRWFLSVFSLTGYVITKVSVTISAADAKTTGNTIETQLSNPKQAEEAWQKWFIPFFKTIDENQDVVKAVQYINSHWDAHPMWFDNPTFKNIDARLHLSDSISKGWKKVTSHPKYIKSYPGLYDKLWHKDK